MPVDLSIRSDLEQLIDYKSEIFSRWKVQSRPGERISYFDGVVQHEAQRDLHFGPDTLVPGRRMVIPAAQRSGKSIFIAAEDVAQLGIPGTFLWHCAPTYDLCAKAWAYIWDAVVVQRVLGDVIDRAVDSKDEREIRLRWGNEVSWVRTRSTDPGKGYQQLVGDQLDGVSWDECGDQPEDVVKRYLLPRLVNRRGWFCAISEPKEFNWFHKYFHRPSDPQFYADGWRSRTFSMSANPFIDAEEIEKLRRALSHAEAERVIEGRFSSLAGQVWPGFKADLYPRGHLYDPTILDGELPHGFSPGDDVSRFRVVDIGLDHPTACLWIAVAREGNDRYIYRDYEEHLPTHKDHAEEIAARTEHPVVSTFIGADAKRRSGLTKETRNLAPIDIYRQSGIYCRVVADDPGSNSAGISAIGQMLANALEDKPNGPRLFVSNECKKLIDAILSHTYKRPAGVDETSPTDIPSKYRDDLAEALRRSGKVQMIWRPSISRSEVDSYQSGASREKGQRRGMRGRASVPRI